MFKFASVALAACLSIAGAMSPAARQNVSPTFVIKDVRLFDGERLTDHRNVLVRDGVIERVGSATLPVPASAEVIEGRGRTLMPGLIDAHVHLTDDVESDLRQAASLGVTTVLDMFTAGERFQRIKAAGQADRPDLADVRTAGTGASVPGGHPSIMGGPAFPTLTEPGEAAAFVDARIAEGSDFIKIIYDDVATAGLSLPMLKPETMRAVIVAAHQHRKLVVVHIMSERQAREAIEAGADGLAHMFVGATVSPDFAELVAKKHVFVIATIGVLHGICGKPDGETVASDPLLNRYIRPELRPMLTMSLAPRTKVNSCVGTDQAMRELVNKGVPILAGTDAPTPTQTFGASLHAELESLANVGLTPLQALVAATSAPAGAFGLVDRGRIRKGLRADLLLVDGDPFTDIRATRRIVDVWKRGLRIQRLVRE